MVFALDSMSGCPNKGCAEYRNYNGLAFMYYCFLAGLQNDQQAIEAMKWAQSKESAPTSTGASLLQTDLSPNYDDNIIVERISYHVYGSDYKPHLLNATPSVDNDCDSGELKCNINIESNKYRITLSKGLQVRTCLQTCPPYYWEDVVFNYLG